MIKVDIIEDSIHEEFKDSGTASGHYGKGRLTTLALTYPRFIHGQVMAHRELSRNAGSSQATPVHVLIKSIIDNPSIPLIFGKAKAGMQDGGLHTAPVIIDDEAYTPNEAWILARDQAINIAQAYNEAGYHKRTVNRLLEPFSHITTLVTSSSFANLLWLRDHGDATQDFAALARLIDMKMQDSIPRILLKGDYHLPYISDQERCDAEEMGDWMPYVKSSVARCARVSYLTHGGENPSMDKDLALYDRLVGSEPLHASPTEHQAQAIDVNHSRISKSNFDDMWEQYRKTLEGEYHASY